MRTIASINVVMAIAFLLSVVVQINDPDPFAWMLIYGLAAFVAIAFGMGRFRRWMAGVVGLAAVVWAVLLVPSFVGQVTIPEVFGSLTMKTDPVERAREFGGLMLVAAWMGILLIRERWGQRKRLEASVSAGE